MKTRIDEKVLDIIKTKYTLSLSLDKILDYVYDNYLEVEYERCMKQDIVDIDNLIIGKTVGEVIDYLKTLDSTKIINRDYYYEASYLTLEGEHEETDEEYALRLYSKILIPSEKAIYEEKKKRKELIRFRKELKEKLKNVNEKLSKIGYDSLME